MGPVCPYSAAVYNSVKCADLVELHLLGGGAQAGDALLRGLAGAGRVGGRGMRYGGRKARRIGNSAGWHDCADVASESVERSGVVAEQQRQKR